jgi:hypothetical protein
MCRTKKLPHGAAGGGCRTELLAEAADVIAVGSRDRGGEARQRGGTRGQRVGVITFLRLGVATCMIYPPSMETVFIISSRLLLVK